MNLIIVLLVASAQYTVCQEKDALNFLAAQLDQYCKITNEDFVSETDSNLGPMVPSFGNYTLIEDMIIRTFAAQINDMAPGKMSVDRYNQPIAKNRKKSEENWREIQELKILIDVLMTYPDISKTTLATTTSGGRGCSGLTIGGKCYVVVVRKMRPKGAASVCRRMRGKMANIYSLTQYSDIMDYIPQYLSPDEFEILLGMTYNNTDAKVSLSFGRTALFLPWLPGFPNKKTSRTQVGLRVNNDKSLSWKGMFNGPQTGYGYHGVLCEMNPREETDE